ncbi:Metal-dependent hydrolase, beta-lactamase superfamily II [Lachnospiraceae bacterium RM5]|nr:Metal-dependent hydrolase, beta-lactamase superfamily II [Lachnospiraceae bacterium RM5]
MDNLKKKLLLLKKISLFVILSISILSMTSCGKNDEKYEKYDLEIDTLSVGKADAIIITIKDKTVLIDCGEEDDSKKIIDNLKAKKINHIDLLMITHFDKDHVGGAKDVINEFDIDKVMYPDYEGTNKEYEEFLSVLDKVKDVEVVSTDSEFTYEEADFSVYPVKDKSVLDPEKDDYDNEMSLVTRLNFGKKTFLFAGDIEKDRIGMMLDEGFDFKCDWLKFPHHGSYCKYLEDMLNKCDPEYVVMSVDKEEPVEDKAMEVIKKYDFKSFDTSVNDIITYSDGEEIEVVKK